MQALSADSVKSGCDPQLETFPYSYLFTVGSVFGVGSFLYGSFLASTGSMAQNALMVAISTATFQAFAVSMQFFGVM